MRRVDADRSWEADLWKPWFTEQRRDGQGRSNARHSWLVTALHRKSRRMVDACARTFLWKNSGSEGAAKVVTNRKHSIKTHFLKDRNCDLCLRTNITRVPCRRRDEGPIPRAEKFGDLTTADHKILNEGTESRNNHRYAVVVQDLATQWIQSYPCETITSQETEKSLRKFMERPQKPKGIN